MSETRYRANLLSGTIDEIQIVNESLGYVDIHYPPQFGRLGATIRREAKATAYTRICDTKQGARDSIHTYALEQLVLAEQAVRRWADAVKESEDILAKPTN